MGDDDVLVLEGGGRLGGRIHTEHFPAVEADERGGSIRACRVDLGASYLHVRTPVISKCEHRFCQITLAAVWL